MDDVEQIKDDSLELTDYAIIDDNLIFAQIMTFVRTMRPGDVLDVYELKQEYENLNREFSF